MTRDVVFGFSYESLTDAAERGFGRPPDRLLCALAESPRVGTLLIANPWRSRLAYLRWSQRSNALPTGWPDRVETKQVEVVSPRRWRRRDPVTVDRIEDQYAAYDDRLRRAVRELGLIDPAVVTFHPFVGAYCDLGWASSVTYYARDDWTAYPPNEKWHAAYESAYARMRDLNRNVIAVSQVLLERLAPTGVGRVVPNGIEPREWLEPSAAPEWLDRIPRPRLLYTGTIDDRLDVMAIERLAVARPEANIILVGPQPDATLAHRLAQISNVRVVGPQPRADVAAITKDCDVGLLAHVRSPLTAAMSPLKVYEYLAAGLPVVATALPPVTGISERLLLVEQAGEWEHKVDDALALGPQSDEARLEFIRRNSWSARHSSVMDMMFAPSPGKAHEIR